MAYLTQDQLDAMGFAALGQNVQISDRASIYGSDKMRLGDHVRIDDFCVMSGHIDIGRNVHIATQCMVAGGTPGVTLGDFAGMAYGSKVFAQSDDYSGATLTNPTVPDAYKSEIKVPVYIGRHVILGTNAVVGPGITLGDGCAIGAGSVVLHSFDPWTIAAGVPARRIKDREQGLLEHEHAYLGTGE